MDKQDLIDAIKRSGGTTNALDEADALWVRLDDLQQTGRYQKLLSQLAKVNDRSIFIALILEVNFPYQFESQGLELYYEQKQDYEQSNSIDFRRMAPSGDMVYFELRLLQQRKCITESINAQMQNDQCYEYSICGQGEKDEIVRIQKTVLGKVQDRNGNPIRFRSNSIDDVNIVAVDVTGSNLGTIDLVDCILATSGDPGVDKFFGGRCLDCFRSPNREIRRGYTTWRPSANTSGTRCMVYCSCSRNRNPASSHINLSNICCGIRPALTRQERA